MRPERSINFTKKPKQLSVLVSLDNSGFKFLSTIKQLFAQYRYCGSIHNHFDFPPLITALGRQAYRSRRAS